MSGQFEADVRPFLEQVVLGGNAIPSIGNIRNIASIS